MADVASDLKTWSTTESSNGPSGTTSIGTGLDDNLRMIQTVVRQDLAFVGADIASATTTDLGAVKGSYHNITGTTTITSFGTVAAGISKWLKFAGALVLTHNSTSLILPTGASITTAAGDTCKAVSLGSGNWIVTSYQRATGRPLANPSNMADTNSVQTFTNKTLTSPTITSPSISGGSYSSATLTSPSINTGVFGTAVAVQSTMETGTSTSTIVTPGVVQYHPSANKAWVRFDGTGATGAKTILASYNVSSVTKNATGDYTVAFTTPFSSADYCVSMSARRETTNILGSEYHATSPSTTGMRFLFVRPDTGASTDSSFINIKFCGDQ